MKKACSRLLIVALTLSLCVATSAFETPESRSVGDVQAVYGLLERVLPGSSSQFAVTLGFACADDIKCWALSDTNEGLIGVQATTASEATAAIGYYLREFCNLTFGWPRGGGSYIVQPPQWPRIGNAMAMKRITPWSYIMNVCTHSYSLVWYDWAAWERFIDWMALSGINMALAMTGQEEVQYKVFQQFGLQDSDIRHWFNGPAFLTWSRGQNEYGNNIAGPLPRSFMQNQWQLQKQILARYRSLGIVSQLPAFQGNVPIQLKTLTGDSNITQQGMTGWMNSVDPLFGKIADAWMSQLLADFGTDHWYQLDGYFNGGTAPWMKLKNMAIGKKVEYPTPSSGSQSTEPLPVDPRNPPCRWAAPVPGAQLHDCVQNCRAFENLADAQAVCVADARCGGITFTKGQYQLRASIDPAPSQPNDVAYPIANEYECHKLPPDSSWMDRGAAAFAGLTRTDPDAIWSFQGWAIADWDTALQASQFEGFVRSVPPGRFVVIDMSMDGKGFWQKWDNSSFFGAPFIWTSLHDFGGNLGIKGNISQINQIPNTGSSKSSVIGTGYTPEGIDQNPAYYDFLAEVNFHGRPLTDVTARMVDRAHRRYGLLQFSQAVADAWTLLLQSAYSENLKVHDETGVSHFPAADLTHFEPDLKTPTLKFCQTRAAWGRMNDAAASGMMDTSREPFRYDLINLARECLAQLSSPASVKFYNAINAPVLDSDLISQTGAEYQQILSDLDLLLASDSAFQLGPWLASARSLAEPDAGDCLIFEQPATCPDFYEWNARVQVTSWHPIPKGSTQEPADPNDYANKQWSGLISDYYLERIRLIEQQALSDAAAGRPLDKAAVARIRAEIAYNWTTATNSYPVTPVGDAVQLSIAMFDKYSSSFASC